MKPVLPIFLLLISGCAINSGVCQLAPLDEGWIHLEEKPNIVRVSEEPIEGHYFEWFQGLNGEYLRCQRPYKNAGCGESIRRYDAKSGERIDEIEIHMACLRH